MSRNATAIVGFVVLAGLFSVSGCHSAQGFNVGLIGYPIPLSPFFQDRLEDNFHYQKRYARVPIMGPITAGPHRALDPPSEDQVMRALEKARPVQGGLPLLHEVQRNDVRIIIEPIADYVDPPRVYPLIGPAQLHHAHYKCIIYFTEVTRVGWPIPYTTQEEVQEVIYIDKNHLHLVGNIDGGPGSNYY